MFIWVKELLYKRANVWKITLTEKYLSQEQGPLSRNHFEKKQNVEEEKCWRASCWQANVSSVNVGEQSGKEHLSYNPFSGSPFFAGRANAAQTRAG